MTCCNHRFLNFLCLELEKLYLQYIKRTRILVGVLYKFYCIFFISSLGTRGGGSSRTSFVSSSSRSSSSHRLSGSTSHTPSGSTRSITSGTASQTASQLSSEECETSISLLQSSVSELTRMLEAVKEEVIACHS